jgi:hypothetical protein
MLVESDKSVKLLQANPTIPVPVSYVGETKNV